MTRHLLHKARICDLIALLPPAEECYLVGGALRDALLGRESSDFDFATPYDPTALAKKFAARVGGHWFSLDPDRRQSRVVHPGGSLTWDFAPFRAADLEGDLRLRDFTINAVALPLRDPSRILDPLGGREDLRQGRLRACGPGVLRDDPLRVLKGVRHCAVLGLSPVPETADGMVEAVPLLKRVAPERIRNELASLFAAEPVGPGLRLLETVGLDRILFGESGRREGRGEGLAMAARWETLAAALRESFPESGTWLTEELEAGLSRGSLLKLSAFYRGWKVSDLPALLEGLRFGRRSLSLICGLQALGEEQAGVLTDPPPTLRGRALQATELPGSAPENLLFLSLWHPGDPESSARAAWSRVSDYQDVAVNGRIPDLLNGRQAGEVLGLSQGAQLGDALTQVRREEIAGRVQTPEDAREFLKSLRKKIFDKG